MFVDCFHLFVAGPTSSDGHMCGSNHSKHLISSSDRGGENGHRTSLQLDCRDEFRGAPLATKSRLTKVLVPRQVAANISFEE